MSKFIRGTRAGLVVLLVALTMLFAALPASADNGKAKGGGNGGATTQNVTWE